MKRMIVHKMNVRSAAMVLSIILIIAGIWMICNQINQNGKIDIKSAFISGTFEKGSVGVCLIFLAVIIALSALYSSTKIKQETIVQIKDVKVTFRNVHPPEPEDMVRLAQKLQIDKPKQDDTCG